MTQVGKDTLGTRSTLSVGGKDYAYYSFAKAEEKLGDLSKLPNSMKVLLENLLRFEDGGFTVSTDDIQAIADWAKNPVTGSEIQYRPARVLLQDFTGVPCVVDLAAMRDAIAKLGGDTAKINPQVPVNLVIDHSVMVDEFGHPKAFEKNVELEYARNAERYDFLKWGSKSFENFSAVPPGTGICHQVNLEHIGKGVWSSADQNGELVAYPDTCVGTDSHTTMINGLGVLGWGVGGIEAEAAMLGQPISMLIPEVVGFELTGKMAEGVTATDLVLTCVQMLREVGVVGRFVEFYGEGVANLTLADRATIANMAPEYGATCGFFGVDQKTIDYLRLTGRSEEEIALVEAYAKEQGMWFDPSQKPVFSNTLSLDVASVVPSLAGPKRPQDKVTLPMVDELFNDDLAKTYKKSAPVRTAVDGKDHDIGDGDVVIAAITSCTNTSNPDVLIAAGLVAKKAVEKGLKPKPWVKTSLAPGSQVVTDYLDKANLSDDLDALGFNLVGYGCTTCIGNSGPIQAELSKAIADGDLVATSVLSGNRNFEGRISPDVRANYLASPPLVVAYAIAGTLDINLAEDAIGQDKDGNDVFLKDIWPTTQEVAELVEQTVTREAFQSKYADVFKGDEKWQGVQTTDSQVYDWPTSSTYVQNPPYFQGMGPEAGSISDVKDAKVLAILGDMITTDHISPAGSFKDTTPAGQYLIERQVPQREFNSYGSRRGNHEVMMRGTFANIRIKNEMLDGVEGGYTLDADGNQTSIYDAAMDYQNDGTPLVIFGGEQYGAGSSRDWAAKGTALLGVKAVIAESFERIHRSNLVGMGVIPFEFTGGDSRQSLGLKGDETVSITGLEGDLKPLADVPCAITFADGTVKEITLKCRIDTEVEIEYIENGGVLHYVLRNLAKAA
jgi:aconitate hydratase